MESSLVWFTHNIYESFDDCENDVNEHDWVLEIRAVLPLVCNVHWSLHIKVLFLIFFIELGLLV